MPAFRQSFFESRSCTDKSLSLCADLVVVMHVQFKEAILMPSQLGIVMEYAAGGDLRVRQPVTAAHVMQLHCC